MLDFDHYNKLKEASIVPDRIRKMYDDDGEFGKVLIEMCVPAVRVAIYAATHELEFFSDLLGKMKKAEKLAPYFHVRMDSEELFRSLCLLGDECLSCLLSELDCSDSVFNGLRDSVINQDPDAFKSVLQGWNGNFSSVTPICRLLSLELFLNDYFEEIIKEANRIDEITDLDQQNQEGVAFVRNAFGVFLRRTKVVFKDVLDDELNKRLEEIIDEILDSPHKLDEVAFDCYKDGFVMGVLAADPKAEIGTIEKAPESFFYKVLLIAYNVLATKTSISQDAKRVIEETLFVPEFETIWRQYKDSRSIDYLIEEVVPVEEMQQTPQIEEPATEEKKDTPIPEKIDSIEQEATKEEGPLYPDSRYGFIPENYFDQKIDKAHPLDHYNLVKEIQEKGVEQFFDFITYLVGEQYIENDNKQKALFAYRLTGRLRPKDDVLPTVWWSGKNNSPKELLYIIRYCVDFGSKKKFSKQMKDFFEGPDWPTEGYSTKADDADADFRQALHDMYEVCGLKYNQPKKKKKKY